MNVPQNALRQQVMETALVRLTASVAAPWDGASYAQGAAGQLLAVAVLSERCGRPAPLALIEDSVQQLLAQLPALPHGLYQGAEGVLFAALELDRHYGFGMAQDAAHDFDEYLLHCLHTGDELPVHFDLISGISGLVVYAAYRVRDGAASAVALLEAALARLGSMARVDAWGTSWFTPPAWVHGLPMGAAYPLGCTDMGIAHGQAGVLAALAYATCCAPRAGAQSLLTGSLAFMRRHGATHVGVVAGDPALTRCAWCAWADRLLDTIGARPLDGLGFVDPWLCHGSMGSAWLLRQHGPARNGLADAIDEVHLHHGEGGIASLLDGTSELSLLEGLAGVALACAHDAGRPSALRWSLPLMAGRDALR